MISSFPIFKKIEIQDKSTIEKITSKYPPYSDYNFTSLWTWDTENATEISLLNSNLVVLFKDYITKDSFYSFLGTNEVDNTIIALMSHAKNLNIDTKLHLIPEPVIKYITRPQNFEIYDDPDNFDYILSVSELINFQGKKFRGKRNFINRFTKLYGNRINIASIDLSDIVKKENIKKILQLFFSWEKNSKKTPAETKNELKAIQKLLKHHAELDITMLGLYIDNQLIGFSIDEIANKEYGIVHYEKADISFSGAFQYLKQQSAINFEKHGCKYINYEQDLGIEGLRKAKRGYNPIKFLKKYTISLKAEA